jgi:hypothetical protein
MFNEKWERRPISALKHGDLIEDPANQAAHEVDLVEPVGGSDYFYTLRAGTMWFDFVPHDQMFWTLAREES